MARRFLVAAIVLRIARSFLRAVGAVAAVVLVVIATHACGETASGNCTDKATCAGGDGSAVDEASAPDGSAAADTSDGLADVADGRDGQTDVADACSSAIEDCTNGVDDNCNGLEDCLDPQCTTRGFSCQAAAPVGWSGPGALWQQSVADAGTPPQCPSDLPRAYDGNAGLSFSPATCGCTCGAVTCGDSVVFPHSPASCASPRCGGSVRLTTGACVTVSVGCTASLSWDSFGPVVNCQASPSVTKPPPMWSDSASICGPPGTPAAGGCGTGTVLRAVAAFAAVRFVHLARWRRRLPRSVREEASLLRGHY